MNYNKIISESFDLSNEVLSDFFISESKKAQRDEFVSPTLFFNGCMDICDKIVKDIQFTYFDLMSAGMTPTTYRW